MPCLAYGRSSLAFGPNVIRLLFLDLSDVAVDPDLKSERLDPGKPPTVKPLVNCDVP